MIHAASIGLRPHEVADMTWRELECFTDGYADLWHRFREALAWAQTNLINVHIPRSKPRVRIEQLLPKRKRPVRSEDEDVQPDVVPVDDGVVLSPVDALAAEKKRRQLAASAKEDASFWSSAEGKELSARLEDQEREFEPDAED